MKRACTLAVLLLALSWIANAATTCVAMTPLKPVHRIWGIVFSPSGDPVTNAKVSVLQKDKEVATQQTDEDGKFSFDSLKPGKYELRIHSDPDRTASIEVVLLNPQSKPNQEIAIKMDLGNCHSFALVDPRKFHSEPK
jgi:hypothetical protein